MQDAPLEGLLKNLSPEEKAELEALLEPTSFEAGAAILQEGGPTKYLYLLTSGTAEVHKEVFPGRRQHLATIEAPAFVGEMGLMGETRAAATVTAKETVEARRLPREVFLEKLEVGSGAAFKIAYEIGRTLAERMFDTNESVAKVVAQLEDAGSDLDVFRDKLIREWSF